MKFTSPVYSAVSGSIAGITYSHNAGGMYARARAVPTNPNSTMQQAVRMYLDSCVTFWTETLDEGERETWRNYAANVPLTNPLGASIQVSGQNMFCRSGVPWLLAGKDLADIAEAPLIFDTGDPGTLAITVASAASNTVGMTVDGEPGWAGDADAGIFGFVSLPQNPSVNFYKGPFRFAGFVPGNASPIVGAAFTATNANPPIELNQGQKIFLRVRALYADGRLTQAFIFDAIVGA